VDVSGDNKVAPLDVLLAINSINRGISQGGAGEGKGAESGEPRAESQRRVRGSGFGVQEGVPWSVFGVREEGQTGVQDSLLGAGLRPPTGDDRRSPDRSPLAPRADVSSRRSVTATLASPSAGAASRWEKLVDEVLTDWDPADLLARPA
jgi:hypothetical protein